MKNLLIFLSILLWTAFDLYGQQTITVRVTNAETGDAIPGVSVVVKGQTTVGTSTDMEGEYSLQVPAEAQVLVFSFVGMQTLEEPIQGCTTINAALDPYVEEMESAQRGIL